MYKWHYLPLAAAVLVASISVTTVTVGKSCRQVCRELPNHGLTSSSSYDCEDAIRDTGGFCTVNGRLNLHHELPRDWKAYSPEFGNRRAMEDFFSHFE
jgi:hypothetical protein